MEERGLVGLGARSADGEELGLISEVATDEESGEVTHVVVEREGERLEVPIARLVLDPEADFATVHATVDAGVPDDVSGDPAAGGSGPEGYAPAESPSGEDDLEHEGQLVSEPEDPSGAKPPEDLDRESGDADGWEDEEFVPDSGYPRTDAYVDPETGETVVGYPEAGDAPGLEEAVSAMLEDTGLRMVSVSEGVVELAGSVARGEELDRVASRISALEEVFEVDTTGVGVG